MAKNAKARKKPHSKRGKNSHRATPTASTPTPDQQNSSSTQAGEKRKLSHSAQGQVKVKGARREGASDRASKGGMATNGNEDTGEGTGKSNIDFEAWDKMFAGMSSSDESESEDDDNKQKGGKKREDDGNKFFNNGNKREDEDRKIKFSDEDKKFINSLGNDGKVANHPRQQPESGGGGMNPALAKLVKKCGDRNQEASAKRTIRKVEEEPLQRPAGDLVQSLTQPPSRVLGFGGLEERRFLPSTSQQTRSAEFLSQRQSLYEAALGLTKPSTQSPKATKPPGMSHRDWPKGQIKFVQVRNRLRFLRQMRPRGEQHGQDKSSPQTQSPGESCCDSPDLTQNTRRGTITCWSCKSIRVTDKESFIGTAAPKQQVPLLPADAPPSGLPAPTYPVRPPVWTCCNFPDVEYHHNGCMFCYCCAVFGNGNGFVAEGTFELSPDGRAMIQGDTVGTHRLLQSTPLVSEATFGESSDGRAMLQGGIVGTRRFLPTAPPSVWACCESPNIGKDELATTCLNCGASIGSPSDIDPEIASGETAYSPDTSSERPVYRLIVNCCPQPCPLEVDDAGNMRCLSCDAELAPSDVLSGMQDAMEAYELANSLAAEAGEDLPIDLDAEEEELCKTHRGATYVPNNHPAYNPPPPQDGEALFAQVYHTRHDSDKTFHRFMELPKELRGRVYSFLLVSDRPIAPHLCDQDRPADGGKADGGKAIRFHDDNQMEHSAVCKMLSVTRVSRQVRAESLPAFYGENTFDCVADTPTYFSRLGQLGRFHMIHKVDFVVSFWKDEHYSQKLLRMLLQHFEDQEKFEKRHIQDAQNDSQFVFSKLCAMAKTFQDNVLKPTQSGGDKDAPAEALVPHEPDLTKFYTDDPDVLKVHPQHVMGGLEPNFLVLRMLSSALNNDPYYNRRLVIHVPSITLFDQYASLAYIPSVFHGLGIRLKLISGRDVDIGPAGFRLSWVQKYQQKDFEEAKSAADEQDAHEKMKNMVQELYPNIENVPRPARRTYYRLACKTRVVEWFSKDTEGGGVLPPPQ